MLPVFGWMIGAAVVGAGKFLLEILEDEASSARSEWRERSEELAQKTDEYNRTLERQLTTSAQSIEFKRLTNLYRESRRKADLVHRSLQEGRTLLSRLDCAVRQSAMDKTALIQATQQRNHKARQAARSQLEALNFLRSGLFAERTRIRESQENLLGRVRELNQNTHQLKLQMRDNCGHAGRCWFDKIEGHRLAPPGEINKRKG